MTRSGQTWWVPEEGQDGRPRAVVKGKLPAEARMQGFEPGFAQKLRRVAAEHTLRGSEA